MPFADPQAVPGASPLLEMGLELEAFSDWRDLESHLLRILLTHTTDYIYFKDLQSRFIRVSRTLANLFGLDPEAVVGKSDADFFTSEHASQALKDEQEIIRRGEPLRNIEERETWLDGRSTWVSTTKAPLRDSQGNVIGTFGISRDITAQREAQEALVRSEARHREMSEELATMNKRLATLNQSLQELSLTDPLTGLRNRRFLSARIPDDIRQVTRAHQGLKRNDGARAKLNVDALFIMVDIDHFKTVNDRYGHPAGDRVLQQVACLLRCAARTSDTVARIGGEEFLIVARQTCRSDAHILAERIRSSIEAHPFDIGLDAPIHCTVSLGFCVFPPLLQDIDAFDWEKIMDLADQCLYAAKHGGRNAWVGLAPGPDDLKDVRREDIPHDPTELIRSGLLPTIQSFQTPLHWEFESDGGQPS